jgi:NADH:ubiquinone oxidoreductase subunit E
MPPKRRVKHPEDTDLVPLGSVVKRFDHGSRVPGWDRAADLAKDPAPVPDPAVTKVPGELRTEIETFMARYPDRRSAALPALAAAQRLHGWCSPEAIDQVACVMRLTPGYLTAVATFYDMLDTEPVGRHRVYVCTNISCSLNGADRLYEQLEAAVPPDDPDINLRHFECLGACDLAPMASIDGVYVGPIELDEIDELLRQVRADQPPLPDKQLRRRMAADPRANTREFPAPDPEPARPAPGAGTPGRPTGYGPPMHTGFGGEPPAPIEQPETGQSPSYE